MYPDLVEVSKWKMANISQFFLSNGTGMHRSAKERILFNDHFPTLAISSARSRFIYVHLFHPSPFIYDHSITHSLVQAP